MRIGPYRHRVNIMSRTQGVDDYGAPLPDGWESIATVWASIDPLRGSEYYAGDSTQSEVTCDIRMRYRPDLTTAMQIHHGDDKYDIIAVLQSNRHEGTTARCKLQSFEQYSESEEDTSTTTEESTTTEASTWP